MINDCSHRNPIVRDGVSQKARLIKALDPSFAKVDERSLLDLLTFIKKYAGELAYYNYGNKQDGTWDVFFMNNCICFLADIADFDIEKARSVFANAVGVSPPERKRQLKSKFDLILTLIYESEKWLKNVDNSLKLYNEIRNEITASLSLELLDVVSYYKKALHANLIKESDFDLDFEYKIVASSEILTRNSFSEDWFRFKDPSSGLAFQNWTDYYTEIPKSPVFEQHSKYLLEKSFNKVTSTYGRLLGNIDSYLNDMLENYPSHEPHLSLSISFLQLFKYAQNQINTLTKRHLDFYFEDVLGLKKKNAVADKAHIVFELAKGIKTYKVKKNTAVSAGKDETGKEILFHTNAETVFNTASISEIRNVYIDQKNDHRIYASPVANSPDGLGGKSIDDPFKWKPFGTSQKYVSTSRSMPDASIGFLIASETLRMSEGIRKIRIDIHCANLAGLDNTLANSRFNVRISGEKGWIERPNIKFWIATNPPNTSGERLIFKPNQNRIQLFLTITEEEDPISALDPAKHDKRFDQKIPGIFLECSHAGDRYAYEFLKRIRIERILIKVTSESNKNLLLQSDQSILDPAKPFNPFGTIPKAGSSFVIGSKEIFNKKLSMLQLKGKWNEFPSQGLKKHYKEYPVNTNILFKGKAWYLKKGNWISIPSKNNVKLFQNGSILNMDLYEDEVNLLASTPVSKLDPKYSLDSQGAFIRLELKDVGGGFAFGHHIFPKIYTEAAILNAKALGGSPTQQFPNNPYTPAIKDFALKYKAIGEIKFGSYVNDEGNDGKVYQVHPFGYYQLQPDTDSADLFLLPQFNFLENNSLITHNGELMIGLDNTEIPTSLNLLFKVAEGSENPELPSQQVDWFYLQNDRWIKFEKSEVLADNTRNLTTTGILSLSVPRQATLSSNTVTKKLLWIMASVSANTDAACDIITIYPQAIMTEFKNKENDPERTGIALKSMSISKLKVKDPSIKSVLQPYASFGGSMQETADNFYLRASERLRHKQRGITIWDYERIILQEIPDLFKVKCINHTGYGYYDNLNGNMDSEFAPGYVIIIVIPKTFNLNAINRYEPKVTKAKILEIEDVIKKRVSPFAARKLKVLNPRYEQIQMDFEVEFYKQYSDRGYYEKQLNEDIKKFLSPWAYSEGKDIAMGGRISRSVLTDFIEELPYVDYLKEVKMNHYIERILHKSDIDTAYPSRARSAFVTINDSDYKKEHIIREIS